MDQVCRLRRRGRQWIGLARVRRADGAVLEANDDALRADNRLAVIGFWQLAALALVVTTGELLAGAGEISIGMVATFVLVLRQLFDPVTSLAWLYGEAPQARANLARLLQLLELPTSEPGTARPAPVASWCSTASDSHTSRAVRCCTTCRCGWPAGDHVAFVGPTGAGKSTVAKLAAGLLAPDPGRITLGGVDLSDVDPVELRRRIVLLPQEGHVLAGTLAENLRLVPGEHTGNDLIAAVGAAGLDGWLARLPDWLATVLHGRGGNLSAGERQLVALARAALADPAVLIFDEPPPTSTRPPPRWPVSAPAGR